MINLSPEKQVGFGEAFRVLRVGGRLAISDVVAIAPIPEEISRSRSAYPPSAAIVDSWMPGASKFIASATIEARRGAEKAACCPPGCCE